MPETQQLLIAGEWRDALSVMTANGVDDAVRLANDTEYGLSAAVFGQDTDRALSVAPRGGSPGPRSRATT